MVDDGFYSDADIEMAELEEAGNAVHAAIERGNKLRAQGRSFDAAHLCPHSAGYGLRGSHAKAMNDPDVGHSIAVFRCTHCGAALDREPWDYGRIVNVELAMIQKDVS